METEKYQKELFEFEPPKKTSGRFGSIFPRTDLAITLTPEKIVFTSIGVIMLLVIFFALGVEKGRAGAYTKFAAIKTAVRDAVPSQVASAKPVTPIVVVANNINATKIASKIEPPARAIKGQAAADNTRPYMVVAAAYSREDFALKEVGKLKAAGFEAFVHYKEPYYLACAGSFQNKDAAWKILNKVRQMHRDAYVRLR
jgi:hypothetical protein